MKWFTVIVTKSVHSENMSYDMTCVVSVLAKNKNDAMKAVRPEFRFAHLAVE